METNARFSMYTQLAYLVDRQVDLRLEEPLYYKIGEAVVSRLGETIIRIDPRLEPEAFYQTYLHELAHIYLRHLEGDKSLSESRQIEHDAKLLAGAWATMAQSRHDNTIEGRLQRLTYHFRQTVIRRLK